jgi:hypothetical protein
MRSIEVCPAVKGYEPVMAYISFDSFGTQHVEIVVEETSGKKTSAKFSYDEGQHASDETIKEIWGYYFE